MRRVDVLKCFEHMSQSPHVSAPIDHLFLSFPLFPALSRSFPLFPALSRSIPLFPALSRSISHFPALFSKGGADAAAARRAQLAGLDAMVTSEREMILEGGAAGLTASLSPTPTPHPHGFTRVHTTCLFPIDDLPVLLSC